METSRKFDEATAGDEIAACETKRRCMLRRFQTRGLRGGQDGGLDLLLDLDDGLTETALDDGADRRLGSTDLISDRFVSGVHEDFGLTDRLIAAERIAYANH